MTSTYGFLIIPLEFVFAYLEHVMNSSVSAQYCTA
jgi:hypothetical protein